MFSFLYVIVQIMALTAKQLAHGLLGLGLLWFGWHTFMAHEAHLHTGTKRGEPTSGHVVAIAPTPGRDCLSRVSKRSGERCLSGGSPP